MNSTALAFAGGFLCGMFAGALLFSILILAVIHLADEDNNGNNDNNDNNKKTSNHYGKL